MQPLLGRTFNETDQQSTGNRQALISEGLWRRRFGGQNSIIGSKLLLNEESLEVVGVLPRDVFNGVCFLRRVDVCGESDPGVEGE